jgi:threonine synthase
VAPLKQLDDTLWLMELFHGPTLAFKDYPLQLVGRLFDHVLADRGEHMTIVGATSGDTGAAAMEACRDRDRLDVVILFPKGRISDVQRRIMTTLGGTNTHAVAIDGTFDDCQDLVKAMFNDAAFRDELRLSAVNSINFARIAAQVVYYVAASLALGGPDREVAFAVPTGNFGNVYAAHVARMLGLPITRLLIASNRNDILPRFFASGTMSMETVVPTLSPAMDIQVSSNFERLLFELFDRSGERTEAALAGFRRQGSFAVTPVELAEARGLFASHRLDDDGIRATIAEVAATTGEIIDPHTACGVAAAKAYTAAHRHVPVVALACAHPAKFPDAVEAAAGKRPALPAAMADLYERPEHMAELPNDLTAVQDYVRQHSRAAGATTVGS